MEWAEIKRRLREGASVQILADLNGVTYKTMYNRIMAHQIKDGVIYLTPENTKGLKKAKAISKTKQAQAKAKEKAAGLPEEIKNADMVTIKGIRVEGARDIPEDPGKLPEDPGKLPEVVPDDKPLIIPFPDPEKDGLCPEVMDVLRENFETCSKLAKSYARQASDYAHLLKLYGVEIPEAQKKKAEELRQIFRR